MAQSLDIFSLRGSVISEYRKFATSFTTIYADDIGSAERITANDEGTATTRLRVADNI
jgi:hypothetical protein